MRHRSLLTIAALALIALFAGLAWQAAKAAGDRAGVKGHAGRFPAQLPTPSFARQVVLLTNAERGVQGLSPLKNNVQLDTAAQGQSQAMAAQDFFDHTNPVTGSTPGDRVTAAGYVFRAVGENIALGQPTPNEVLKSWMNSPGHRANILSPDYREIGVGYVIGSGSGCKQVTCEHYWTQIFGAQSDVYPLIISDEAFSTATAKVHLYIYGTGWAQEMRLSNDGGGFGAWQPFQSELEWDLAAGDGEHTVTVELRNGPAVVSASDSIYLASQQPTGQPTAPLPATPTPNGPHTEFMPGDIFAAVNDGKVLWYRPDGTLNSILDTQTGGQLAGMAFDSDGNLYVTGFTTYSVTKFDRRGNLLGAFGDGYTDGTESIVFDSAGNVYVGAANGDTDIRKFDPTGKPLAQYDVATEDRGSDWVELDPDQCTMYYTSEGTLIKRYDVCSDTQLSDFASGLHGADYALRLLPGGDMLVADSVDIHRLDASGSIVQTYDAPGEDCWFALNRAPDDVSFWSGDICTDNFYKFNISTGDILLGPISACDPDLLGGIFGGECLAGLAIFGELIEAVPATPVPSTPTPIPTPLPPDAQTLRLDREVAPTELAATRDEATVTLTLAGDNSTCPPSTLTLPVDVVLVIDRSGSMGDSASSNNPQAKLDAAKAAAKAFVDSVIPATDRVAVVAFDDGAYSVAALDGDQAKIKTALDSIAIGGGTNIAAGLQGGLDALAQARADASQVIVLLSDGQSDLASAQAVAAEAAQREIKVVSIGFGDDADPNVLQAIASTPNDYYFAPDAATLQALYPKVAQSIRRPAAATDVTLTHRFDASHFSLLPDSLSPAAENVNGGLITWKIDQVGSSPVALSYRVRARYPGEYDEIVSDQLDYLACGDATAPRTIAAGVTGRVTITAPPVRAAIQQKYFTCAEWWWLWLVPLALPLLLLLLLLLWYLFLRSQGRDLAKEYRKMSLWCLLARLALLLWILFLLFLIGREIAKTLCLPKEVVYFWRMEGGNSDIAAVRFDRDDEPIEFAAANNTGCVGCHALSPETEQLAAINLRDHARLIVTSLEGEEVSVGDLNAVFVAWSRDGKKLAYARDGNDIYVVDFDAGTNQPLAGANDPAAMETMPAWSADGATIAFARVAAPMTSQFVYITDPVDIHTVPSSGGTAQPLPGASGDGFNYYPAYSPDGRWLAFTRHTAGVGTYADPAAEIYLVPAGGGEAIRLEANDGPSGDALNGVSNSWPTWSSDGKWLAFNSKRNDSNFDIFITEINQFGHSGPARPLAGASDAGVFEHLPQWGPPFEGAPLWQRLLALWPWLLPLIPLIFLVWWLCRPTRFAITGRVTDADTGEPLPGGVSLIGFATTILNADGRYRFGDLKAGDYHLSAASPGYQPEACDVSIKGKDAMADFQLRRFRLPLPPPAPLPPWQPPVVWEPDPALIIGVGGTGRHVLTHLKKNLRDAGAGKPSDRVRFLLVDTDEFERVEGKAVPVSFAGVSLDENDEVIVLRENLNPLVQRLKDNPQADPDVARWFPSAEYLGQNVDLQFGTQERRPPARAGLFADLKSGPQSAVWQSLLRHADKAQDQERVRVIVVGSTAGGLGSGVVADLAFLARRAGLRFAKNVTVEAYLALDAVFPDWTPAMGVNTFATVRELGRLQMLQGYRYPVPYRSDLSADEVFNGAVAEQLFDQWYLFDADRERQTLGQTLPAQGVFPTIADTITLWLDKASHASSDLSQHRRTMLGEAVMEQFNIGSPVVGGLGSYAYRLPTYDIVERIKTRWGRELLSLLLSGDLKGAGGLDPALNREHSAAGLQELAREFLSGLAGYGECPPATRLMGEAAAGQMAPIEKSLKGPSIGSPDEEREKFANYLAAALAVILNGQEGASVTVGRGGKIGYAVRFIESILDLLRGVEESFPTWAEHVADDLREPAGRLAALPPIYRAECEKARADLLAQASVLAASLRGETAPAQPAWREQEAPVAKAALEILREREATLAAWQEEMDAVKVRRYIWKTSDESGREEMLAERWYRVYVTGKHDEHLARFHWRPKEGGGVELVLRAWEDLPVESGPEGGQALAENLLRLAGYVAGDIWEKESLAGVLATTDLRPDRLAAWNDRHTGQSGPGTANILWNGSGPLLPHDPGRAANSRTRAVLGVNRTVEAEKQLAQTILRSGHLVSPTHLYRLSITDPYSLLLVQLLEIVPLTALYPERPEAEGGTGALARAARQYFADVLGWIGRSTATKAYTPHIFAAERNAQKYERRLAAELNLRPAPLHPLIVTALEDEPRARQYALAYAAGMIITSRAGRVELHLPGRAPITLADPEIGPGAGSSLAPTVRGLLAFAAGEPEWIERVGRALKTREAAAALKRYRADRPDLSREARRDARDFAAFVWLVVNDA